MRMVMMNGGLGNQAFQYIFLRYLEEKTGQPHLIDDIFFCGPTIQHNGYELEKIFSIRHSRLSEQFDSDTIKEMYNLLYPTPESGKKPETILSLFRSSGINLVPVQEGNFYQSVVDYKGPICSTPANQFFPNIVQFQREHIYYYGYWINAHWFGSIRETILREFTFPPLPDAHNQSIMNEILSTNSIAVHIRRGDFVDIGWAAPPSFYCQSLHEIRAIVKSLTFFIFSDDMLWVKSHLKELGFLVSDSCIFVEGNGSGRNYIDMQLMSNCRGMIITNSSFGYLGALLNQRKDKVVYSSTTREII